MTARVEGDLARFAVERNSLKTIAQRAKLFRPTKQGTVSISRIEGLDCHGIVEVGLDVVERHANATVLHGWVEFTQDAVEALGVGIDPDDDPPRHAHIVAKGTEGEILNKRHEIAKVCHRKCLVDPPRPPGGSPSDVSCENIDPA